MPLSVSQRCGKALGVYPTRRPKGLDRDTVLTLIDHIEVHETERINGEKRFRISVFYKFVGNINSQTLEAA